MFGEKVTRSVQQLEAFTPLILFFGSGRKIPFITKRRPCGAFGSTKTSNVNRISVA
jgi:hypothetical protein